MKVLGQWLVILWVVGLGLAPLQTASAQDLSVPAQLHAMAERAETGMKAAEQGDRAAMQAEFDEAHEVWETFEGQVREQNSTAYVELEGALDSVKDALHAEPFDAATVRQAYDHLMDEANEIAQRFADGVPAAQPATTASPGVVLDKLDEAYTAVEAGDAPKALAELSEAIALWPSVEGAIAAKSQEAYSAIESDLGRATAALRAADLSNTKTVLERLRTTLAPFSVTQTYNAFDAAAIILREGLEALLVIVALLAFLQQSNNGDKRRWIWAGAGVGVLVSIASAFVLQIAFNRVSAGQNREVIEGVTGLLAAVLLFYVSYWLHSKSSLRVWQQYINTRTSEVLATGSMFGLALLSFLAVFREGAETTIFYLGMAPAIAMSDLLLGLGIGSIALIVMALLMLMAGVRLPLRLFFRVAGLLVYYLGFKFVGAGIHALQVAGILPTSPIGFLREIPFIGVYPTWETLIPQFVLLALALGLVWYLHSLDRQVQENPARAV